MITEARSTTVAPASSAWLRSSAGIHFAVEAEDRLAGSARRAASRGRRRWRGRCPGGASPRATSTPKSLIA